MTRHGYRIRPIITSFYVFVTFATFSQHAFAIPMAGPAIDIPFRSTSQDNETDVEPSWVKEPVKRGSMGLLWSCTTTILLAVWSTLHVNVQMAADATLYEASKRSTEDVKPPSTVRARLNWIKRLFLVTPRHRVGWKHKLLWAVLTAIVPELPLIIALGELKFAKDLLDQLQKLKIDAFEDWDLKMAFYVVMGGYYVHCQERACDKPHTLGDRVTWVNRRRLQKPPITENTPENVGTEKVTAATAVTERPAPESATSGIAVIQTAAHGITETATAQIPHPDQNSKSCDVLTPHGFLYIAAHLLKDFQEKDRGEYERLKGQINDMTTATLSDMSKANTIAKVIVFIQAAWIIIQVIGRFLTHLPITILELHTAAHAVCAIVMYATWWEKPLDIFITTPICLSQQQYEVMKTTLTEDITNHVRITKTKRAIINKHKEKPKPEGIAGWWSDLLWLSDEEQWNHFYLTSQGTLAKEIYKQLVGRVSLFGSPLKGVVQALIHIVYSWGEWRVYAAVWFLVSAFYSTCHLVSWNWHFPAETEALLWHLCTLYTASSIVALCILAGMMAVYDFHIERRQRPPSLFGGLVDNVLRHLLRLVSLFLVVGIPFWVLARVFMAVEAYISIRNLKKGSFDAVQWTQAIPHLG